MDKKQREKLNSVLHGIYEDLYEDCKSKYNHADQIYGVPTFDLFQRAVERFIEWMESKGGAGLTSKINEGYIRKSIVNNFKHEMQLAKHKQDVHNRSKDSITKKFYSNNENRIKFTEYQDLIESLGPTCRSFIRLRVRDGATIEEVKEKLDISSNREYYRIKAKIKHVLKKGGIKDE